MTPQDKLTEMLHASRKGKMRELGMKLTDRENDDPENRAMADVMKWLDDRGIYWYRQNNIPVTRFVGSKLQRIPVHTKGISDIVAVIPKYGGIFIEVKRFDGKGVHSDDQKKFQADVESHGGIYLLVDKMEVLERRLAPLLS